MRGLAAVGALLLAGGWWWASSAEERAPSPERVSLPGRVEPVVEPTTWVPVAPAEAEEVQAAEPTTQPVEADGFAVVPGVEASVWPASAEGVRGAMRESVGRVQDCYRLALREGRFGTELVIEFDVVDREGVGEVDRVEVVDGEGPIVAQFEDCVLGVFGDLAFDPPDGTMTVRERMLFFSE